MSTLRRLACFSLLTAAAWAQNPPIVYAPASGTQDNPTGVDPGSTIKVTNDLDIPVVVQPRESNAPPEEGTPIGEPFWILANSNATWTVPNTPALLGMPFELDPNTHDSQLLGH